GGIGSGKSTVASLLATHGAVVIDADAIARAVVEPGSPVLQELAERFGADVLDDQGSLRRTLLAERAFASKADTDDLNAIMHPRIRAQAAASLAASSAGITVYDMPLLVETGQRDLVDVVVVVDVPEAIQVERAQSRFGPTQVHQRMQAQASRAERLAQADYVIDNSGSTAELAEAVRNLWNALSARLETHLRFDHDATGH
ncbi:MAG: dephospho-CoA kinase, partial [Actinomycetales bacterium]